MCIPTFFCVVQLAVLPFFPDAPRYILIEKGNTEQCRKGTLHLTRSKQFYVTDQPLYVIATIVCVKSRICVFSSAALQCLWGPGDYKLEIEEMSEEQAVIGEKHNKTLLDLLRDKHLRWQILSLLVIIGCIQFSGVSAVNQLDFIFN